MADPCFLKGRNMMKAAGITAEYNPLHNGHVYHIEETKRITGCDAVVAAMSGDFVQRGEPAIMDKWVRTEHALRGGADLVIEIPALFCLGNAGQYADAAVKLLEATGKVSHISFGSESGDAHALTRIAGTLRDHNEEIECLIRSLRGDGFSYPAARSIAYSRVRADLNGMDPDSDPQILKDTGILDKSNDILAVEYIRSMQNAEPAVIQRKGAGYTDSYDESMKYQSASAIRTRVLGGHDVTRHVPAYTAESLKECHLTGPDLDGWFDVLRYAVLSADAEMIEDCPSGGEGLAYLMKSQAGSARSWTEFVTRVKSRRYTYTRLSRLCMQLLLGISRSRYDMDRPEYIRVLGFSETGRKLLAEMRDEGSASLPVVINVNKSEEDLSEKASSLLQLDIHAADIYNLVTKGEIEAHSDHRRSPVMI